MASFGCYDNSDVISTRIITNFHLYLIQLWWQFFRMFVYGVVVYAQKKLHRYWPWKTVSSHFHMLVRPILLHLMALVSVRLFCKNLGNLQEFFGKMVYRPPPWQKIARTPMPPLIVIFQFAGSSPLAALFRDSSWWISCLKVHVNTVRSALSWTSNFAVSEISTNHSLHKTARYKNSKQQS